VLAEGLELLSRVPDLGDAKVPLGSEENVVLQAIGIWPQSRRLEATRNLVVLLSRHVRGAEANNDAHCGNLRGWIGRPYTTLRA
jgi:hypothetical protein